MRYFLALLTDEREIHPIASLQACTPKINLSGSYLASFVFRLSGHATKTKIQPQKQALRARLQTQAQDTQR